VQHSNITKIRHSSNGLEEIESTDGIFFEESIQQKAENVIGTLDDEWSLNLGARMFPLPYGSIG